ncbi:MAG: J domain-containing protein [Pseudomonadota bacterium]|nr:J domain-containing protein [Pseudomonadota bacterium]
MTAAFQYRPKFVDIRVRPPKEGETRAEDDVFTLKPGEKPCEAAGCRSAAAAKAPKGRGLEGQFYEFCAPHAAEYNKSWDYFAGMSEAEIEQHRADAAHGHRPTWSFKASNRSREAAAAHAAQGSHFADPFGMFTAARKRAATGEAGPSARPLGKLERAAFLELELEGGAEPAVVRARYHALIKRLHPDSNGGDRSTEDKLGRVIKAYKTLKASKLA